ncbi:MAG: sigma-70 family RNA polymerase sigma factor [Lentisphaerae bacterium]|nr:sigma-70 family RNA polymerase sigma factor [Lentisphaerota bacterium]
MENEPRTETEADLIRRLKGGESDAFDILFERHRRGLFAYIFGYCRDRQLAEDVVQDTFLEFVRRIDSIRPGKGANGWLYRVARNRTIDVLRHRQHEVVPGDDFMDARGKAVDKERRPDQDLIRRERREQLRESLDALPEKDRELLLLRFYGGLTFREAGEVLGRPLGTVLWQGRRALEKLRAAWIERFGPEEGDIE